MDEYDVASPQLTDTIVRRYVRFPLATASAVRIASYTVDLLRAFPPVGLLVLIVLGPPFLGTEPRHSPESRSRSRSTSRTTTARSYGRAG